MSCASCTSMPAPSTSRRRPATRSSSTRCTGAGATWSPRGRTSRAGSAAGTSTRGSATRTSCRPTAPTRRPARPSPASCSPGACSSRPATPTAPTSSSGPSTTASCPGCPPTGRGSSTSTRCSDARTGSRPTRAPASGPRWYACACCPPNLVRTFGSWPQYLATTDQGGVQVHQYATGEIHAAISAGDVRLAVETDYPWDGRVRLTILEAPDGPWTLALRVPAWARSGAVDWAATSSDSPDASLAAPIREGDRAVSSTRSWHAGDTVVLDLDMPARITEPGPRVDAIRGCRRDRARPARVRHRVRRPARGRRARGRRDRVHRPARSRCRDRTSGPASSGWSRPRLSPGRDR